VPHSSVQSRKLGVVVVVVWPKAALRKHGARNPKHERHAPDAGHALRAHVAKALALHIKALEKERELPLAGSSSSSSSTTTKRRRPLLLLRCNVRQRVRYAGHTQTQVVHKDMLLLLLLRLEIVQRILWTHRL
jgi:hypothetical protein